MQDWEIWRDIYMLYCVFAETAATAAPNFVTQSF